jgi:hypothetical protein
MTDRISISVESESSDSDLECNNSNVSDDCDRINTIIDPSYAPKKLRKNKSITRAEYIGSFANEKKVLVLYTGGTIGMMKSSKGGLYHIISPYNYSVLLFYRLLKYLLKFNYIIHSIILSRRSILLLL